MLGRHEIIRHWFFITGTLHWADFKGNLMYFLKFFWFWFSHRLTLKILSRHCEGERSILHFSFRSCDHEWLTPKLNPFPVSDYTTRLYLRRDYLMYKLPLLLFEWWTDACCILSLEQNPSWFPPCYLHCSGNLQDPSWNILWKERSAGSCKRQVFRSVMLQWSQKVSFHPETDPGFPHNDQNPKPFGTRLSSSEFAKLQS